MKQVERYFYPAVFSYAPDQEIAVTFPDLDVATSGTDDTDALLSARELLGCVLCGLEEDGEDIPAPTPLADVKLEDGERAVLVDVYMHTLRVARVNPPHNPTHRTTQTAHHPTPPPHLYPLHVHSNKLTTIQ